VRNRKVVKFGVLDNQILTLESLIEDSANREIRLSYVSFGQVGNDSLDLNQFFGKSGFTQFVSLAN